MQVRQKETIYFPKGRYQQIQEFVQNISKNSDIESAKFSDFIYYCLKKLSTNALPTENTEHLQYLQNEIEVQKTIISRLKNELSTLSESSNDKHLQEKVEQLSTSAAKWKEKALLEQKKFYEAEAEIKALQREKPPKQDKKSFISNFFG